MTLRHSAFACAAVGFGLTLGGCAWDPGPRQTPTSPTPMAMANVAVTVSSVTKATIAPDRFSYSFTLQLTDSGGVPSTATKVLFNFDNGFGAVVEMSGDQLGQDRRLAPNGALALHLTCVPTWGYSVGNEVFNAHVQVILTDDNGHELFASVQVPDLDKL